MMDAREERRKWNRSGRRWIHVMKLGISLVGLLLICDACRYECQCERSLSPSFLFVQSFTLPVALRFSAKSKLSKHQLRTVHQGSEGFEAPPHRVPGTGDNGKVDWTSTAREQLQKYFSFPLDSWQAEAGGQILASRNTIVCAPTGAGKTVVGEMALRIAFEDGMNAIYTTPLKALSNQKFMELRKIFGAENVGLSTGDMSINRGARITVMTTEVYRNMAWRASDSSNDEQGGALGNDDLASNSVVVLDEFHYMGQPGRGGVWEECVITSPAHTQIVGLSATLPNAARLASWMESVTGRSTTLVEAIGSRPVPLRYLFASKDGVYHLFRDPDAGPGAPKGLLGLRGDGVPPSPKPAKNKDKKKGFSDGKKDQSEQKGGFPKGLKVNSVLVNAANRRVEKVNRKIQRMALRDEFDDRFDSRSPSSRGSPRKLSARQEKRERDRLLRVEMRRYVPSLPFLLKRLEQKNLLPAIFFIFSRAGCDEAAETVCQFMRMQAQFADANKVKPGASDKIEDGPRKKRKTRSRGRKGQSNRNDEDWYDTSTGSRSSSMYKDSSGRSFRISSNYVTDETMASILEGPVTDEADEPVEDASPLSSKKFSKYADQGLLTFSEVKDVASRIAAFNRDNPEIAFSDAWAERFLFGVGSHHAGMLPAHKAFVEILYRAQLMKAVFATETLAAGINMPARTTVICALAKRGDGSSMNLLETANLLQMAGRAGRRGMDTDGTCVIVATPFEGPEEAASILTNEIKPVVSQFTPSYSLAVNLVARGAGKLDVAKELVRRSFAMWEKQQREDSIAVAKETFGDEVNEVLEAVAHHRFLEALKDALESQLPRRSGSTKRSKSKVPAILEVLGDRKLLKKASKSFVGLAQILELEQSTMKYLEREAKVMNALPAEDNDGFADLFEEESSHIESEIDTQRKRVLKSEQEVNSHIFTAMAGAANAALARSDPEAEVLRASLAAARSGTVSADSPVTANELTTFSKSATVVNRKMRKMKSKSQLDDNESLLDQLDAVDEVEDDAWEDMLALTKVLEAYGCISSVEDTTDDAETYSLTPAGENIGILGFENSLWCLVAMGGAWDVANASANLDEFRAAMENIGSGEGDLWFSDDNAVQETGDENILNKDDAVHTGSDIPKPQQEVETLVSLLRSLTPSELAGYVSCLVSEGSRGWSANIVESFQKLSPTQQRVTQSSLLSLERLMEVQKRFSVDEGSSKCQLELSACDVVTAWADGCPWNEAVELSGAAPGDLARTLHRALDALRQLGNLPYHPARATGVAVQTASSGIHPDIRRLCREAARAMDRYPVKDPLPFDEDDVEIEDELDDADDDDMEDNDVEQAVARGEEEEEEQEEEEEEQADIKEQADEKEQADAN